MNTATDTMDKLIERYTSGAMSPAEERAFLTSAGNDPALRELLNAEQSIQSAFAKDRTELFTHSSGAYQRFLARTAAPSEAPLDATGVGSTGLAVSSFLKYSAVILGTIGLSVATFFVGKNLSDASDAPVSEPKAVQTVPASPSYSVPSAEPSSAPTVNPQTSTHTNAASVKTGTTTSSNRIVASRKSTTRSSISKSSVSASRTSIQDAKSNDKQLPVVNTKTARGTIELDEAPKK